MRLSFLGAAGNVTGSRFLLETGSKKILVDCGLHQERDLLDRDWLPFPVPPARIDAVVLTHAHLDHCGYLPRLVREGFKGKIFCTEPTEEIARVVLMDSARIQEEDVAFKQRRHEREGKTAPHPYEPLYTTEDAEAVSPLFSPSVYGLDVDVLEGVVCRFHDAGHILGAAVVELRIREEGDEKTVVFSGDIGRFGKVLLRDPTLIPRADAVVVESTYGDRNHETPNDAVDKFVEIVVSTRAKGGNIVIPSFAIERAQEILYAMDVLLGNDRIPHLITFLDSPMAIKVTEIYDRYPHYLNPAALRRAPGALFDFPLLTLTRTAAESKAINHIKGSAIIIAGSGMCTGGRIKHHLQHNISRAESTILFVGYQAVGTLGRYILGRPESVRIFGASHPVQARIEQISGFSAHAGRDDLLRWMDGFGNTPRRVFVVHGERESSQAFASALRERMKAEVAAPEYGETFEF